MQGTGWSGLQARAGLRDFGNLGRTARHADHALVFMARGLHTKWKQPLAYYLCQSKTPAVILEDMIVEIILALLSAGIYVKAVISDQGSTNRSAIDGKRIVTISKMSHLLKSTINNFQKYNIVKPNGVASWEHIINVNGCSRFAPAYCPLWCWVSESLGHLSFWNEALVVLDSLQFVDCFSDKVTRPPSQDEWITTIRAMQMLWLELKSKGFSFSQPRTLNQDGLENFFSAIQQHEGDNNNPTAGNRMEEDDDLSLANGSSDLSFTERQSVAYASSFIAKKLMSGSFFKDCDVCRGDLSSKPYIVSVDGMSEVHCIIDARDAVGKLEHPSLQLGHTVAAAVKISKAFLPNILSTDDIGRQLCTEIKKHQDFFWCLLCVTCYRCQGGIVGLGHTLASCSDARPMPVKVGMEFFSGAVMVKVRNKYTQGARRHQATSVMMLLLLTSGLRAVRPGPISSPMKLKC
ncbi:hypothetical protein PR048_004141 [Dryococelus australis]|uniref:Uncharacterized protein n=1 Tax=Dryococelus australis TaxID=614101 RepID=A0ABQ9I4M9_9NEOP|nr:hypothetical protein PR048_004141 [Dryococelus australis]